MAGPLRRAVLANLSGVLAVLDDLELHDSPPCHRAGPRLSPWRSRGLYWHQWDAFDENVRAAEDSLDPIECDRVGGRSQCTKQVVVL